MGAVRSHGHLRRALALIFLTVAPGALLAQRYCFRHYGQSQGLANLAVTSLAQDPQGFLWAGTQNGVFRYDGKRFERMGVGAGLPDFLAQSWIRAMLQVPNGGLWIASGRGLARWDGKKFDLFEIAKPGESGGPDDIRALAWDPTGRVLIGTATGLLAIEGGVASPLRGAPSVPIDALYVDSLGRAWFCSGKKVFMAFQGAFEELPKVPAESWDAILLDAAGNLWLRADAALYVRDLGQSNFRRIPGDFPSAAGAPSATLALNERNEVVVPCAKGLGIFDAHRGEIRILGRKNAGLLSDSVSYFLRDREGSAWIAYLGSGVSLWEGYGQWEYWNSDDGLPADSVWEVRQDGGSGYWFATGLGLSHWSPSTGQFQSWLKGSRVLSFDIDGQGDLWVSGGGGLRKLRPAANAVRSYGPAEGLPGGFIGPVAVEKDRTVWVGTDQGLFAGSFLRGDWRFHAVDLPAAVAKVSASHLLFRRNGDLVACTPKGLLLRSKGRWSVFTTKEGLRSDDVLMAAEAPDGALWITYGPDEGLSRLFFRDSRWEVRHFAAGVFHSINALMADAEGRIWVGSEAGVDALHNGRWFHYRRGDGLVWNDVCENSFLADPDGGIWIGTSQGVARFRPSRQTPSRENKGALVQSIEVGERSLDPDQVIHLPYRYRTLTIAFTALIFKNEEAVRFRYRLGGLESGWTETTGRSARYTNLPAGDYVFEVEARGENDTWDPRPATAHFIVATPWYQSWYFFVVFATTALLFVRAFWRWRLAAILARQRQLESAVLERTEELHELASRDALTGLYNRGAVFDRIQKELAEAARTGRPLAIIMADLDHFKSINDRFGHQAGDGVLIECAARLRASVRASDLIGRYGGEELLIVLLNCGQKDALRIAESMRQAICSAPFDVMDRSISVTSSFGVAAVEKHPVDLPDLVREADRALYEAKRAGRNRVEICTPAGSQPRAFA